MAQPCSFLVVVVSPLVAGLQEGNSTTLASCFSELSFACTSTNKKRNLQLKALAVTDGLSLNIGWTKYRWGLWSLSLAEEKSCCTRLHELYLLARLVRWSWLVGKRHSTEPSDGTGVPGPCLTSENGSGPRCPQHPWPMPHACCFWASLKRLQKIPPLWITTGAASTTARKVNVIYFRTAGSTVVLMGHPKGTLPSRLILLPSDVGLTLKVCLQ